MDDNKLAEEASDAFDAAHGLNTAEYALWEVDQALARLAAFPDDALREQLGGLVDTARAIAKLAGRAGR